MKSFIVAIFHSLLKELWHENWEIPGKISDTEESIFEEFLNIFDILKHFWDRAI